MANDFTIDSRCKALWRLENGALTTDTIGTNTLSASTSSPTADTGDYKEGAACADFEYSDTQYFTIADASLDSGFPLKSGETNKKFTWCCWIKQESQAATTQYILSKYASVGSKMCFAIGTFSNVLRLWWGYSSGALTNYYDTGIAIANGEWYHVAVMVDGTTNTIMNVIVYKVSNSTIYTYSATQTGAITITTAAFRIGARDGDESYRWDGKIDEVLVFNDCLTDMDIQLIRQGNYNSTYSGQALIQETAQVAWLPTPLVQLAGEYVQVAWNESATVKVGGVGVEVASTPGPDLLAAQVTMQVETTRMATGIYVPQVSFQVEYLLRTDITIEVDLIDILINQLGISLQETVNVGEVVNMWITALSLAPAGFGISVDTTNILMAMPNVTIQQALTLGIIPIDIGMLAALAELVSKRIFPKPPTQRQTQSQTGKRMFPVLH
jgi:hypothetical protein